jgi:hypothetical protein
MGVLAQAFLHENYIVQRRDDCENKGGPKKNSAANPDPLYGLHFEQKHEEDGAYLREGVGFAEDAGTKIPQTCDGEEHGTGGQD